MAVRRALEWIGMIQRPGCFFLDMRVCHILHVHTIPTYRVHQLYDIVTTYLCTILHVTFDSLTCVKLCPNLSGGGVWSLVGQTVVGDKPVECLIEFKFSLVTLVVGLPCCSHNAGAVQSPVIERRKHLENGA